MDNHLILIEGDWKKYHGTNKDLLYVFEPVVESLLQLLVQSILLYVVLGPSEGEEHWKRTTAGEEKHWKLDETFLKHMLGKWSLSKNIHILDFVQNLGNPILVIFANKK